MIKTEVPVPQERTDLTEQTVRFRIYGEDIANCLNMNRVTAPALLGADTEKLDAMGIFTIRDETGKIARWSALELTGKDGTVPAFVDESVLRWSLGMKPGDIIPYGETKVRIAGTLNNTPLQGYLVLSDRQLREHFPAEKGFSLFLTGQEKNGGELERTYSDFGPEVTAVSELLGDFLALENTYLEIFQTLGIIAFILGGAGLFLVLRMEGLEEGEHLRLMRDLGFPAVRIAAMRLYRYIFLFLYGWAAALSCAVLAVFPVLRSGQGYETAKALIVTGGSVMIILLFTAAAEALFGTRRILGDNYRQFMN